MKASYSLGLLAAALLVTAAAPAPVKMNRAAVEALGRANTILCENWRPSDATCGALAFFELQADGRVRETVWFRLSNSPDVQVGVRDHVEFDGDDLCVTSDSSRIPVAILVNGVPATGGVNRLYQQIVVSNLSEDDGKRSCESFYPGVSSEWLRTVVTVDGKIDPSLGSNWRVMPAGSKIKLREAAEARQTA